MAIELINNSTITGTLTVSGATTFNSSVDIVGNTTFYSNATFMIIKKHYLEQVEI